MGTSSGHFTEQPLPQTPMLSDDTLSLGGGGLVEARVCSYIPKNLPNSGRMLGHTETGNKLLIKGLRKIVAQGIWLWIVNIPTSLSSHWSSSQPL